MRYYCTGCPNDPAHKCCHMSDQVRVDIHDCKCKALGIPLRDADAPPPPEPELEPA